MNKLLLAVILIGNISLPFIAMAGEHGPNKDLMDAVYFDNVDGIRAALAAGANINAEDGSGLTALHIAAMQGRKAVVRLLLSQAGIEVDYPDRDLETPLMLAVYYGYMPIVKLLLEHNASVNARNSSGQGARDLANHPDIRRMLDAEKA